MFAELIGMMAGILTTMAFFPQLYKAWKTKSTQDLSLFMILVLLTGVLLWMVYGVYLKSTPMILANGVTALLVGCLLSLKLRYG